MKVKNEFNIQLFTSRWLSLGIDYSTVFFIFFYIKYNFDVQQDWLVIFIVYSLVITIVPGLFTNGITLGRKISRIRCTPFTRPNFFLFYVLRETSKFIIVFFTAGLALPLLSIWMALKNKPAPHEVLSGIFIESTTQSLEPITDDFEGKFKF